MNRAAVDGREHASRPARRVFRLLMLLTGEPSSTVPSDGAPPLIQQGGFTNIGGFESISGNYRNIYIPYSMHEEIFNRINR